MSVNAQICYYYCLRMPMSGYKKVLLNFERACFISARCRRLCVCARYKYGDHAYLNGAICLYLVSLFQLAWLERVRARALNRRYVWLSHIVVWFIFFSSFAYPSPDNKKRRKQRNASEFITNKMQANWKFRALLFFSRVCGRHFACTFRSLLAICSLFRYGGRIIMSIYSA